MGEEVRGVEVTMSVPLEVRGAETCWLLVCVGGENLAAILGFLGADVVPSLGFERFFTGSRAAEGCGFKGCLDAVPVFESASRTFAFDVEGFETDGLALLSGSSFE